MHVRLLEMMMGVFVTLTCQCLRRYRDENDGPHLANAGKYLSAIVVVFTRIQYGNTDTVKWMVLYIMSSTFATFYQIYWDLVIDWGLLRCNSVNPWLREKLILENQRYVYFLSMVSVTFEYSPDSFVCSHWRS